MLLYWEPAASHTCRAKDSVPHLEPRNVFTGSHHRSGQLGTEDAFFPRLSDSEHEFRHRQHGLGNESKIAHVAIPGRHGGCVYSNQDFVVFGSRLVHLLEPEEVWGAIPGMQSRFHISRFRVAVCTACYTEFVSAA